MCGLRACFNHTTQVFLLELSRCSYLGNISDENLSNLKRLSMARSWIDREIMIKMLQRTRCLQELDMSDVSEIKDNVCEVITKFASHSLTALYLLEHVSFWSQSQISCMLDSCQELVILGVDGDMVDAQFIGDIFKGLKLKKLSKLRLTDVKDKYVIEVLRTINSNHSSRIELCVCRCSYLKARTKELLHTCSLRISLCSQCKYDISMFSWK